MEIVVHLSGGEIYAYSIQTSALQVENDVQNRKPKAKQQPGYWIWKIPHRKASQTEVSATHRPGALCVPAGGDFWKYSWWKNTALNNLFYSGCKAVPSLSPGFCLSFLWVTAKICYENETRWHWREREGIWVEEARHRFKYHLLHNEWYHMKTL